MGFVRAVGLEFLQNLPLIMSFVAGVWLWARRYQRTALICLVAGSISTALVIRFTLPYIRGYNETMAVTAVNMLSLCVILPLFTVYLGSEARWNNWKMDVILGGSAAMLLAIGQGIASAGVPWLDIVLHTVALGLSAPVVLINTRTLKAKPLPAALSGALLITVMMTVIISMLDYSYFLLGLG